MSSVAAVEVDPLKPMPKPLAVKAWSTDRRQHVSLDGAELVRVWGTAVNSEALPSRITLEFNGRALIVPVGVGQTPQATYIAIKRALARRYRVDLVSSHPTPGSDVVFCIYRRSELR